MSTARYPLSSPALYTVSRFERPLVICSRPQGENGMSVTRLFLVEEVATGKVSSDTGSQPLT